jgi:hypothetical protein
LIPRQRRDQGIPSREAEVGGVHDTVDQEATLHADLDTLCTAVYCTADDLLPERAGNARRRVSDAEVVMLCVAQAIMGIPSDRRFLAVARKRLREQALECAPPIDPLKGRTKSERQSPSRSRAGITAGLWMALRRGVDRRPWSATLPPIVALESPDRRIARALHLVRRGRRARRRLPPG